MSVASKDTYGLSPTYEGLGKNRSPGQFAAENIYPIDPEMGRGLEPNLTYTSSRRDTARVGSRNYLQLLKLLQ